MTFRARLFAALLTIAVAPAYAQSENAPAAKRPVYSGFLGDYSKLKPAPDREGVMLYIDRSRKPGEFKKIMFRPMEVYVAPGSTYKGIQPDVLKRMSDQFAASLKSALTPGYEIVDAPGPDVIEVRTAITGFQPVSPSLTPIDFLPIKAVFNAGRAAAGKAPQVAELSAEMEVLDPSGKRIAAAVANRRGDQTLPQGEQVKWEQLQAISDYWSKSFRQRLDEIRSASAK